MSVTKNAGNPHPPVYLPTSAGSLCTICSRVHECGWPRCQTGLSKLNAGHPSPEFEIGIYAPAILKHVRAARRWRRFCWTCPHWVSRSKVVRKTDQFTLNSLSVTEIWIKYEILSLNTQFTKIKTYIFIHIGWGRGWQYSSWENPSSTYILLTQQPQTRTLTLKK